MAAMKIQRIWRGRVFRRDQRRAVQSAKVEANLDVDKEAARLLRDFSQGSSLMDFMGVGSGEEAEDQEDPAPQEEEKEGEGEEENMARVAQKSWKLLAKSRAEFQRQYRELEGTVGQQREESSASAQAARAAEMERDNVLQFLKEANEESHRQVGSVKKTDREAEVPGEDLLSS